MSLKLSRKTRSESRIFFPWENRGGLRRVFAQGRFVTLVSALFILTFMSAVFAHERRNAGERQTLLALSRLAPAVERYLLENDEGCPSSLRAVVPYLSIPKLPRDAWGRPLRLVCPSVREGAKYVLMSDGPDGHPGGLDRIEY